MRIAILTIGTQGDVRPPVALGVGLRRAGHDVKIVTHGRHRALIEGEGLRCGPLQDDLLQEVQRTLSDEFQVKRGAARVWARLVHSVRTGVRIAAFEPPPFISRLMEDSWAACADAEAILFQATTLWGYDIAETLAIPGYFWNYVPTIFSSTREFPVKGWGHPVRRPSLNRLAYWITSWAAWYGMRRYTKTWRRNTLGLGQLPTGRPYPKLYTGEMPFLYAFSPAVISPPRDWKPWHHVTGYWFLDSRPDWAPPAELRDFLAAGPRPICVGFSSMAAPDPAKLFEAILSAVRDSGQRAVVLTGWGALAVDRRLPDDVFCAPALPHDWLFPQMSAVVHHGGAGTTAAALRAGVPAVVVPFQWDQPCWGERVFRLGAGPPPLPLQHLSAPRLTAAIRRAVLDPDMRRRAEQIGQTIRSEDGVGRAVEIFHRHLASRARR